MGCNRGMTPAYGRSERGKRVVDTVPKNYGGNVSVMGMLTLAGIVCMAGVEGGFNAELVFDFFVTSLLPKLKPGQVVILDNARIHKKYEAALRELLASKGCRLVFLPPYSPEWNPIEPAWAKMKQIISRLKARTKEALAEAIQFAASVLRRSDVQGWFKHAGHIW
jgi:transposase